MNQIFSVLKREKLFFVDSYTTSDSECMSSAKLFKVPFARRDVFIDHVQEVEAIRKQIRLLIELAQKNGEAVGIVHPYSVTIKVLNEMLPEIKKKVYLTPVSNLARIIG
jgi:polysaccharide deacetylase 2 family uncharacterized protein YibQ